MGSPNMGEAAFGKTLTLPLMTWAKIDEIRKALGLAGYAEAITWCVSKAGEMRSPPGKTRTRTKHGKK